MRKIYADLMLAKLSRWLRLAGIPVYDSPFKEDIKLLKLVKKEKAVLLTSDVELLRRANKARADVLFIDDETTGKQIGFVAGSLHLKISTEPAGICPVCNSAIVKVGKTKAKNIVPADAYAQNKVFYFCKNCKKVYWRGSHWRDIKNVLESAKKIAKEMPTSGSLL